MPNQQQQITDLNGLYRAVGGIESDVKSIKQDNTVIWKKLEDLASEISSINKLSAGQKGFIGGIAAMAGIASGFVIEWVKVKLGL